MVEIRAKTLSFVVTKERDWYLARAEGLSIFTEARTLSELKRQIKEAVSLHLADGENEKYGLPPKPEIRLVYRFEEVI